MKHQVNVATRGRHRPADFWRKKLKFEPKTAGIVAQILAEMLHIFKLNDFCRQQSYLSVIQM